MSDISVLPSTPNIACPLPNNISRHDRQATHPASNPPLFGWTHAALDLHWIWSGFQGGLGCRAVSDLAQGPKGRPGLVPTSQSSIGARGSSDSLHSLNSPAWCPNFSRHCQHSSVFIFNTPFSPIHLASSRFASPRLRLDPKVVQGTRATGRSIELVPSRPP